MRTQIQYLDPAPIIFPPVNMTATYVEVVGLDLVIQMLIFIAVLLVIIAFEVMRMRRHV